jgi:hypothetical protein
MKQGIVYLLFGALTLTIAAPASAGVDVSINLPFFGVGGYAPPVVYQPDPYYAPPPVVVYRGGGSWGGDHGRPSRGRRAGGGRGGEAHHK